MYYIYISIEHDLKKSAIDFPLKLKHDIYMMILNVKMIISSTSFFMEARVLFYELHS